MPNLTQKTALAIAMLSAMSLAQEAANQPKVGILPFSDATASGSLNLGETLSRLTQAEIVHSTQLEGRALTAPNALRPEQLDNEKILAAGKENNVDVVVMGTV